MDSMDDWDAQELVRRIRAGDHKAWVILTDRYTGLLWSVAKAMGLDNTDAADAAQVTWLRLVENIDNLRDPARVGGWLATTARRECLSALRRRARFRLDDTDLAAIPDPADELDARLLRDERDAALWTAFAALRPPCRRLLRVLMADPPPSYADVAAALDLPVGSIGPTRQRCLRHLRRNLEP
jgi:RNA polymerase sigma factor (sigma-70 family)